MADRKISDLAALTTPAAGDYLPIVDISEPSTADKNKRITIEELLRGAPDGTAAAPGIAFESDPNTGIYSPGADQLAISTAGTGWLFVDANGNASIGSLAPLTVTNYTTLAINGGNGGNIVLRNTATTTSAEFRHQGGTGTFLGTITNQPLMFQTSNTERLRIDSSGRLLVGTSSDSGGALLQVNGDRIRVATAKTPASATATGTAGEICWDANYIYVCTATNTWKRTAIATW